MYKFFSSLTFSYYFSRICSEVVKYTFTLVKKQVMHGDVTRNISTRSAFDLKGFLSVVEVLVSISTYSACDLALQLQYVENTKLS